MYSHVIKNDLVIYKFKQLTLNNHSQITCSICSVAFRNIEKLTEHRKEHLTKMQKIRNQNKMQDYNYSRRKMTLGAPRLTMTQNSARNVSNAELTKPLASLQTKIISFFNISKPFPTSALSGQIHRGNDRSSWIDTKITNQRISSSHGRKRKQINTDISRKSVKLASLKTLKEINQTGASVKEIIVCPDHISDLSGTNEEPHTFGTNGANENINSLSSWMLPCLEDGCDASNSMKV
jgi:hypothetical protein